MLLLPPALQVYVRLTGSNIFLTLRLWKMLYHLWYFQNYTMAQLYGLILLNRTLRNFKKNNEILQRE